MTGTKLENVYLKGIFARSEVLRQRILSDL